MLGPFYHLQELHERRQAASEARRILKRQGILFAAAVNQLAYLRDVFREKAGEVLERAAFHTRFLKDGELYPEDAPPLGYAHLTNVLEFRNLFEGAFEEVALVGKESFVSAWQSKLNELPPDAREAWLDLVEETGKTPEGIGQRDHFLFIGKRL